MKGRQSHGVLGELGGATILCASLLSIFFCQALCIGDDAIVVAEEDVVETFWSDKMKEERGKQDEAESAVAPNSMSAILEACNFKETLVEHSFIVVKQAVLSKEKQLLICDAMKSDQNAIPIASVESDPLKTFEWELVDLKRSLLGDGAHRQLKTSIMWRKQSQLSPTSSPEDQCSVFLLERLPNGIFVDEYELHRLRKRGVFEEVYVYGDKNLELPAINSNQSIVEVHGRPSVLKEMDALSLRAEISVPLHSRYPPLSSETHFLLDVSSTDVVLACSHGQEKAMVHDTTASFYEAQESIQLICGRSSVFPFSSLLWPVPAGNPAHFNFVSHFTGLAAILGAIFILFVSHFSR